MARPTTLALLAGSLLTVGVLGACGDDDGDGGASGECLDATSGAVTIVADGIAWDADCIDAVADEPLTISVDNQDDGVNHNFHLTDAPDEPATELDAGPVVQTLEVVLPEGDYEYVCDIHPNMVGTLTASPANPAG